MMVLIPKIWGLGELVFDLMTIECVLVTSIGGGETTCSLGKYDMLKGQWGKSLTLPDEGKKGKDMWGTLSEWVIDSK